MEKIIKRLAEFLGCSPRKVAYWATHGSPNNLETLQDKRVKGNNRKVTEEYINLLLETVDKEPRVSSSNLV